MLNVSFTQLILLITAYSVLGWVCEAVYISIPAKRFINTGFLNGPYCPVYGIGGVLILAVTYPFVSYPPLVFITAMLTATVVEYITGWLMESLFQVRFWDYSEYAFNIKGRICLKNSTLFGILGITLTYIVHPAIKNLANHIPAVLLRVLISFVFVVLFADLMITLNSMLRLKERLMSLQKHLAEIERVYKEYSWFDKHNLKGNISRLRELFQKDSSNHELAGILTRLDALIEKSQWRFRLIRSFPKMKLSRFDNTLENLRSIWEQRKELMKKK